MTKKIIKQPAALGKKDLSEFNETQKLALLDLFVLAMYLDHNLARVEAARVQQLLGAMGIASDFERNRGFDAAVARVRPESHTAAEITATTAKLAKNFTTRPHQQRVHDLLSDLMALDGVVAPAESTFLISIKETFKL